MLVGQYSHFGVLRPLCGPSPGAEKGFDVRVLDHAEEAGNYVVFLTR